ncbi:peroxisomal coenzyme A diphosphatase NUDT7 isoform X2 [Phascolarctos cinereus]|uniref:Peroxisomal coenzyme A diphosphatase NUDT7 isoform X2 n=1 Tax=Phascolarctos cinereus TaxID=38626 RepID=A0A6P5IF26_PHACI|nr:peroxisomal coenzyme A diphosphatase NUDT7 isoform X2 [Phascolarctos cinereus]
MLSRPLGPRGGKSLTWRAFWGRASLCACVSDCVQREAAGGCSPHGAAMLRTSPGEVCFPGGKSEPGDRDEIATALREAEEEVGLQPHQVEVICRLVPYINKNGAMITPVVGFIDSSFQAQPNPHEVSEVFLVPLEFFLSPRTHYSFYSTIFGHRVLFHYFGYMDRQNQSTYQIWGLTARFALLTALIVLQKQPSFDVEYDLNDLMSSSEQYFVKIHRTVKSNL